ncbi:MAG: 5'/3'-nucleotidase SurE [Nitrospiraceae bacterium]|nr:5'/3'-nucleotidase SurE [Nitrospiraceae bacterium]
MRPLILVTNDDGVHSHGITALQNAMKEIGDVYVVAPDRERSAVGHALTLHRPLKAEEIRETVFSVNGTPTDCVALGIHKILPRKPDLIASGINKGSNLGDDITYSGTVSAAMEGTLLGVPSFAISMAGDRPFLFESALPFAQKIARYILDKPLQPDTFINMNVPNIQLSKIKGMRLTRQGKRVYDNAMQELFSPGGEQYYWIGGGKPVWDSDEENDIQAVISSYVSVTPLHLDLTNYTVLEELKTRWRD